MAPMSITAAGSVTAGSLVGTRPSSSIAGRA
jgi:hypothetical protein